MYIFFLTIELIGYPPRISHIAAYSMNFLHFVDIIGKEGLLAEIDQALSPERKGFLTAKGMLIAG